MGRQIRFFMYGNDELLFLEEVKRNFDLLLDEQSEPIKDFVKPDVLRSFFITKENSNIFNRTSGKIDPLFSEVIQFTRSLIKNDNQLWEGGLWIETKFYDKNKKLIIKPDWIINKFDFYKKWITKNFILNKEKNVYIGKNAYQLYKEKGFVMKNAPNVNIDFD